MTEPIAVLFDESDKKDKKMKATFILENGKTRTIHFGQANPTGKGTYIDHKDDKIKRNWIKRHEVRGKFDDPMTASSLSRWILWNKPSLNKSIIDFKNKFGLR